MKYGVFTSSSEPVLGALLPDRDAVERVNCSCTASLTRELVCEVRDADECKLLLV